jgi:hypothetical protein
MLSFGEKGQDPGSEFVGALDLRHVTDAREQTCLCMWNESTGSDTYTEHARQTSTTYDKNR